MEIAVKNLASMDPFDQLLELDKRSRERVLPASVALEPPAGLMGGLGLRLRSWNLLFPLNEVSEIIPVPRITTVPGVKSWLLGIANLRGTVITVIDLGAFLHGSPAVLSAASRVVIVHSGDWDYGLLVDEIIGMRHFRADSASADLKAIDEDLRGFLDKVFQGEGQRWLGFDVDRLLSEPRFLGAAN